MRTYTLKIFLINFVMLCLLICPKAVNSQTMDEINNGNASYTIAILPIKNDIYGVYNDNLNFVANELTNQLRNINGIRTLNVLNSLRKLKPRQYERHLTSIKNNYNASEYPDPDDLSVIAQVLDADKIILVSGGFNTEKDMLKKSILTYDAIWVVPKYEYNTFVSMFDPFSGNLEWRESFHAKFPFKDALMPAINTSSNPLFYKKFRQFTDKVALNVTKNLQKYFYTTETSTVDVKIIKQKPEATDGDLTTDGQPLSPTATLLDDPSTNRPIILPETKIEEPIQTQPTPENKIEESVKTEPIPEVKEKVIEEENNTFSHSNTIDTPYKDTTKSSIDLRDLKPNYENELLEDYQNKMKTKY